MKPLALVAGALANKPNNGGAAWTRLSWILGLRRMGFAVRFIEVLAGQPPRQADADGESGWISALASPAEFFQRTLADVSVEGILLDEEPASHPRWEEAREWASRCAFLLNITGHLREPRLLKLIRRKVYLDLDPGYTQIWHRQGHDLGLPAHDLHFTVGVNIGQAACPIPVGEFQWMPTRQPSLLDEWPVIPPPHPGLFTTVASWRNPYGGIQFEGRSYGQKVHEFRRFIDLPGHFPSSGAGEEPPVFEAALDIQPGDKGDLRALEENGWLLSDATWLKTPEAFRGFVQASAAEFSVAQGVYVHTRSGWFSDRTVRYLSSGRPALVQDTGLGHNIPLGDGLLTFRTMEEAIDGVRRIRADYAGHSRAARQLAESQFDSRKILEAFLQRIDP